MDLTWVAIIASLLMGIGALLFFIFAVKQDYFRNLEETKYQVFWSEMEELVESAATKSAGATSATTEEQQHGNGEKGRPHNTRTD